MNKVQTQKAVERIAEQMIDEAVATIDGEIVKLQDENKNLRAVIVGLQKDLAAEKEKNKKVVKQFIPMSESEVKNKSNVYHSELRPLGTTGNYTDRFGNIYKKE